eukprot:jgi/Mesen1/8173/ME000439S07372
MTTERARLTGRLGRKSPSGLEAPQAALLLQLAFLLLPGVHGWHNAGARSQLGRTSRQNVCWNGPGLDWGGQPWDQLGQDKIPKPPAGVGVEHNVFVAGEGCRRCVVGTTCTFQLRFASSKLFDTSIMLYHEIMITLHGPALVHAYAVPHGGLLRGERTVNYHVSYKAWDAGNYTVAIQGDCSRDGGKVGSHQLAAFPVVVEEPSDATSGAGGLVGGQEQAEGEGFWAKLMQARKRLTGNTPGGVATDAWGRWKRQEGVATDHTAGQRYLVRNAPRSGKVDSRGFHDNMFWTHRNAATNASLQLNFYWLGGIYTNQDKNCNRDPKEFKGYPTVPATSDVVVIEGAHWSFQATRYEDACMTEDPEGKATQDFHYSCEYANHEHMRGVVGEIITRNFIRSLLVL